MVDNLENNQPKPHSTDERWKAVVLRHRLFGIGWVILALAIVGVSWYGYARLRDQMEAMTQLHSVQKTVDTFGNQIKAMDSKLQSWSGDQQNVRDQMTKLGQRMAARIEREKRQAQKAPAEMFRNVQSDAKTQMLNVQTRLARLESSGNTENARVADLQRDLAQVRSEMAEQVKELHTVRSQIHNNSVNDELQLAILKSGEERNRKDVDAVSDKLALRRIDFEATKNHNQDLAPGISLTLTGTDVNHRRVKGYLWLLPDRRTIWLRSQGAQQPVIFYGYKDGVKRELVITNVTKDSATGYLLLPKGANTNEVAAIR